MNPYTQPHPDMPVQCVVHDCPVTMTLEYAERGLGRCGYHRAPRAVRRKMDERAQQARVLP